VRLREDAVEILERHGIAADKVRNQWGPTLEFELADGEERWTVSYNVGNRGLGAWPAEGRLRPESVRQFLLRMHFSHGYGPQASQRDLWAVVVDLVTVGMVLWVLSGLLMWWQMRVVRLSGGIVLILSGLLACGLGYVMYEVFSH